MGSVDWAISGVMPWPEPPSLFLTTAMWVLPADRVTLPGLGVQTTAKLLLSRFRVIWLVLSHSTFWAQVFNWLLVAEEPEMFTTAVLAAV